MSAAVPTLRGVPVQRIERAHRGWKIAAGPYDCDEGRPRWKDERRQAREALALHQLAGTEAKFVKVEGLVYVLRSEIGWREYDCSHGGAEPRVIQPGMLRCPLCGCGPFFEKGLRLHGCRMKPKVTVNGRLRCGRLDHGEIQRAIEAVKEGAR